MFFYSPEKAEEGYWDEDGADVCERETVFGDRIAVVAFAEGFVYAIDLRYKEPDRSQETKTGSKVEKTDLFGTEAVVAFEYRLHVGVQRKRGAEYQSLVGTHDEDNGLSDDSERPL